MAIILDLSGTLPQTFTTGNWPQSAFNSDKYHFVWTPTAASTDAAWGGGFYCMLASSGSPSGTDTGGLWVTGDALELYNQSTSLFSRALTWSAGAAIDITIDMAAGSVTIAGATTGNGTFAFTPSGTVFTSGTIGVGVYGGGGFSLPSSTFSDIDDVPSTDHIGTLAATLGAVTLASAGAVPGVGTLSATLGTLSLAATGTTVSGTVGDLTATLGAVTLASAGVSTIAGATAATLGALTVASAGTVATGGGAGNIATTLGARLVRWLKDYDAGTGTWDDAASGAVDATDNVEGLPPSLGTTTGGQSYPDFLGVDQLQSGALTALPTYNAAHHAIVGFLIRADTVGPGWVYGVDDYNNYVTGAGVLLFADTSSNASIANGVWRRVIVARNGTSDTTTMYINGVAQTATSATNLGSDWKTSTAQTFGDRPGAGYPFDGGLASFFQGYDTTTAFSAGDIAALDADLVAILDGASVSGTLAGTLGALAVASAGTSTITGALAGTLSALTVVSAGAVGGGALGALASTLADVSVSSAGVAPEVATLAATLGVLTLSSVGTSTIVGALATTLGAVTLSSSDTAPGVFGVGVGVAEQEINAISHGGSFTKTTPATNVTVTGVDASTNVFTSAAHGSKTGDGPYRFTTTGTLPAGLALATDYFFISSSSTTFRVATTGVLAIAGTAVDITDTGSGTHTLVRIVDSQASGSIFLAFVTRGEWDSAPSPAPTDNKSNSYSLIGSTHTYSGYPNSKTGAYYAAGSGGAAHTWSAQSADFDEVTIAALEIKNASIIQASSHVERASGSATITSSSVTTTASAYLVAVCFGIGPVGQDHTFTPGAGWTKVPAASREADMSANGYIQVSIAYRYYATPGTYTVDWSGTSNEGAQLYLIAVQDRPGTSGVLAATLGAATVSAAGTAPDNGVLAATLAAVTTASAGAVRIVGTAAGTLGAVTVASAGTTPDLGTAAITLVALVVSSAGSVPARASATITLAAATAAATAAAQATAALAATLGTLSVASAGVAQATAALTVTLGSLAVVSAGTTPEVGTLSTTLADVSVTAAGTVSGGGAVGALAVTLGSATLASAATSTVSGALTGTLAAATMLSSGAVGGGALAALVATLDAVSVLSAGTSPVVGALVGTLGNAAVSAVAATFVTGSVTGTLGDAAVSSAGSAPARASLSITLGTVAVASTGSSDFPTILGDLVASLSGISISAAGTIPVRAALSVLLGALTTPTASGGGIRPSTSTATLIDTSANQATLSNTTASTATIEGAA